jgi:glycosyltransferase involved in cell wall biosynthesis
MPLLYTLMDVLALPSLFEGIPRAVMEASAMGIPTVATDVKGNREAVVPGQNGSLVPYGRPDELARALQSLLTDEARMRMLGVQAQRLAAQRFDEQRVFQRVLAKYEDLLALKVNRARGRAVGRSLAAEARGGERRVETP